MSYHGKCRVRPPSGQVIVVGPRIPANSREWASPEAAERRKRTYVEWRKNNPDRHAENNRRQAAARRARERGAISEDILWETVWTRDRGICGICGELADHDRWHLDHIIPLARGGSHTMDNVQVAHPRCNMVKWANVA